MRRGVGDHSVVGDHFDGEGDHFDVPSGAEENLDGVGEVLDGVNDGFAGVGGNLGEASVAVELAPKFKDVLEL